MPFNPNRSDEEGKERKKKKKKKRERGVIGYGGWENVWRSGNVQHRAPGHRMACDHTSAVEEML